MSIWVKIGLVIVVALFIFYIFNLVKKKKIRVEYSIYWIMVGAIMLLFGLLDKVLLVLSELIQSPEMLLMALTILVILLIFIIIDLTIIMTKTEASLKELTQDLSLIKFEEEHKNEEKS